jgi:hypothetical protein
MGKALERLLEKTEETKRDEFPLELEKLPVSNSNLSWN